MKKFIKILVKTIFILAIMLISIFLGLHILEIGIESGLIKSHIESNQVLVEFAGLIMLSTAIFFLLRYFLLNLLPKIIFICILCPILWIGCKFFDWPVPPTYRKDGSVDYHDGIK